MYGEFRWICYMHVNGESSNENRISYFPTFAILRPETETDAIVHDRIQQETSFLVIFERSLHWSKVQTSLVDIPLAHVVEFNAVKNDEP